MDRTELSRRDFAKLTAAAFGGLVSGASAGCGRGDKPGPPAGAESVESDAGAKSGSDAAGSTEPSAAYLLDELHVCRGLNTCAKKGASGENACAGQGTCASASIHHDCGQQNACKGQGGCGEYPGWNGCKELGGCHVPLMEHAWTTAREAFEKAMKEQGKEVGAAPPAG